MDNYSTLLKELRKMMQKTDAKRYWGTLVLLIFGVSFVAFILKLPEILSVIM